MLRSLKALGRTLLTRRIRTLALRGIIVLVLDAAIAFGANSLSAARTTIHGWNADEGITFLTVACHAGDFESLTHSGSKLYARWVRAAEWQRVVQLDGRMCLGTIRDDLVNGDVHPPLYFWLLHLWALCFGTSFAATILLQASLFAGELLLLYVLAQRVLASRFEAAAVTWIAAASSVGRKALLEFRPYVLLGFVTVLFVLVLERCSDPARQPRLRGYLGLGLATAAGVLTHYLFAFVMLGALPYACLRLWGSDRRRVGLGICSIGLGCGAADLAFPLLRQLRNHAASVGAMDHTPSLSRLKTVLSLFASFFAELGRRALPSPFVCLAVATVLLAVQALARGLPRTQRPRWHHGWQILILVVGISACFTLQHVFGVSPPHAKVPKYFASIWPLAAFVPVIAARVFGRARGVALSLICLWYIANNSFALANVRAAGHGGVVSEPHVIIDMTQWLRLPRILPRISADALLFVADQPELPGLHPWQAIEGGLAYLGCRSTAGRDRGMKTLVGALRKRSRMLGKIRMSKCWEAYHFASP